MAGTPGAADDLADRMAGPAALRHRRAARAGAGRAGGDERRRRPPRDRRARRAGWPPGTRTGPGRGRARRPARVRGLRRGRRRGAGRGRVRRARRCPARCPTPVLAFAVRQLGAVAGVQITASHNPPADNGYKVYLADGAQLAPPADAEIEAAIAAAPPARLGADRPAARRSPSTSREAYLDRVAAAPPRHRPDAADRAHPAARRRRRDRRARAARGRVHRRPRGRQPRPRRTPAFPTVAFPNPEEPGATDAVARAGRRRVGADLAVALDPDADRCALGVPTAGGWRMLTGDETGVLLGDHLLRTRSATIRPAGRDHRRLVVDAARGRRGARRPLRRDAHRVQVDRPRRARAGLRLRGGARATASTRTPCATRTASPPPCSPATSPRR